MLDNIIVKGARTHNLKNIDVRLPKNQLIVITGLSGSGKSSLAFDTIYAEGQRRYVESLSAYARQFLGLMDKPDVDLIEGLSPAISIDQKSSGHNPRSTVGTVTEIYDYLRLLYARVGHSRSPATGRKLEQQTVQQIVDTIIDLPNLLENTKVKILLLAPVIKNRKGTYDELFSRMLAQGFARVRVDNEVFSLEEDISLDRYKKHNIDIVVDRLIINKDTKGSKEKMKRITDSVELCLNMGDGELLVNLQDEVSTNKLQLSLKGNNDIFFSEKLVDPDTGESFPEIEPHSFSFNSPHGACEACNGLGNIKEFDPEKIYNPKLSVTEGGIYPLHRIVDNKQNYTMSILHAIADKEGFSLRDNLGELEKKHLDMIMLGTGNTRYEFTYTNFMKKTKTVKRSWEGIIGWLEKKYENTDSDWVTKDIEQYMVEKTCDKCLGYRLKRESLAVTIGGVNISDIGSMPISEAHKWIVKVKENKEFKFKGESTLYELFDFKRIDYSEDKLTEQEREIGKQVFKEIEDRLNFLLAVGLEYLTLNRTAKTLSGGESQRIRLASQIGTGLTGVLYILDEPSIGLHQRDNERLIKTLERLRDIGNTVIVVEHDEDTIRRADHLVDIGPAAGEYGGEIVFSGKTDELLESKVDDSITGKYLRGDKKIDKSKIYEDIKELDVLGEIKRVKRYPKPKGHEIVIRNVQENNLKGFDFHIPLTKFVAVTGVSGSGKSSMVNQILVNATAKELNNRKVTPGKHDSIEGLDKIDKLVEIDQSPIGRTPRSNPATYTKLFDYIRNIFAETKEAKTRGYKKGRFSFNVKGGRCEKCQGAGVIEISMQFLPDVYVKCDSCKGQRYNRETLQIDYKGKNISEVLDMTVDEALKFFENISYISTKLKTLSEVGLDYIRLGQAATTLSGGESQRIKLASELSKRQTGKTLYVLDEPTTGLHFEDVRKLLIVLHGLVAKGNTVLVIEHNLDVIKTADWIVDLGPEGGKKGGQIVAEGTVEDVIKSDASYTGKWLKKLY